MRRAFTYRDERSDKFWRLDVSRDSFATFHGPTGAFGKTGLHVFDSDEECSKAAERLIASKLRKGYRELSAEETAAAFEAHWFFDTASDEHGMHPKTSHPRFSAHFTAGLYYDVGEEFSPFGSDEGADALSFLEEGIREQGRAFVFADFPRVLVEERYETTFSPPVQANPSPPLLRDGVFFAPSHLLGNPLNASVRQFNDSAPGPPYSRDLEDSDLAIIATAFGQAKITGRIDLRLKADALLSLERLQRHYDSELATGLFETMKADLKSFV